MTLAEMKQALVEADQRLSTGEAPFVAVHTFERNERPLILAITPRLRSRARRARIWKSKDLVITLKNAAYGFDEAQGRSRGGSDGIFLLDRTFQPPNEMMRKIFTRYLDLPGSGAAEVASALGTTLEELVPVRLVSHHLRLLGVLFRGAEADTLVLVDFDQSK